MSPLEIALVIIGIVCIVASCFLIEHKKEDTINTELGTVIEQIFYSKMSEVSENLSTQMSELRNQIMEETKDELVRVSNEKIMAVHEYSEQILGDMKKNHSEVMFLYQMLTDKEDELKKTLAEIQQTKREMEHFCSRTVDDMNQEYKAQIDQSKVEAEKNIAKSNTSKSSKRKKSSNASSELQQRKLQQNVNVANQIHGEQHFTKALEEIENQEFSNHIGEILALAQEGYSIVEISKRLELGQGEVKLVLDYNKR